MTMLDDPATDPLGATTSELSEELIFLIASASSGDQRRHAAELFRHYSRQLEAEAYQRGRQSAAPPQLPPPPVPAALEAPAIQPAQPSDHPDAAVSLIPQVRWQD